MKQISLDNVVISLSDAAKLIGKSARWVNQLVNDGYVKRAARGLYKPADVAKGFAASILDDKEKKSRSGTLATVQSARAREIDLRVARRERKLVDIDEAIDLVDEIIGMLKSDFDGAAASITRDQTLRNQIEGKIDEILDRASDRLEQKANALRSGGDATEADTDADTRRMGGEEPPLRPEQRHSRSA
jgi:hypothetical protein